MQTGYPHRMYASAVPIHIREALDKKKEMLEYIREQDLWLYHKLRYSILGRAANLPGRGGRKMFVAAYKVCQKFYGFN